MHMYIVSHAAIYVKTIYIHGTVMNLIFIMGFM